ncbi:MAG: potassium channel family protein [bacterium]
MLRAIAHPRLRGLISIAIVLILFGTIVFIYLEGWSFIDALYFTISTMTTVGFGDLAPTTPISRIVTTIYMLLTVPFLLIAMELIAESVYERMLRRGDEHKVTK